MKNNRDPVRGTIGYAAVTRKFIDATLAIDFWDLHRDFIEFIPEKISRVLDVGAGIGRDAWEFSKMGHSVTAVEPTREYRRVGRELFGLGNTVWINDSLPELELLGAQNQFDFILASGVLHHLDAVEQYKAIVRISELLSVNGIFALSLRNGPAGAGTSVFPTNSDVTIKDSQAQRLKVLLRVDNQPSLMKNKKDVLWSKLVFQKEAAGFRGDAISLIVGKPS